MHQQLTSEREATRKTFKGRERETIRKALCISPPPVSAAHVKHSIVDTLCDELLKRWGIGVQINKALPCDRITTLLQKFDDLVQRDRRHSFFFNMALVFVVAFLCLISCTFASISLEIETEYGRVLGVRETNPAVIAFYNIPFATPPTGNMR